MHNLDTQAPGLAKEVESLSLEKRRRILAAACDLVGQTLANLDPSALALLEKQSAGTRCPTAKSLRLAPLPTSQMKNTSH